MSPYKSQLLHLVVKSVCHNFCRFGCKLSKNYARANNVTNMSYASSPPIDLHCGATTSICSNCMFDSGGGASSVETEMHHLRQLQKEIEDASVETATERGQDYNTKCVPAHVCRLSKW